MKSKNLMAAAALAAMVSAGAISCNKEKDRGDMDEYSNDQMRLEQTFEDVQNIADQAATTGVLSTFRTSPTILSGCATITHDTISNPHILTVDFGTSNCLCVDGRLRRGQIIVSYAGHYRDSGHVHTITFNDYYVNNNQVTGIRSITNMGHNSAGQTWFQISVNGALILANGNGTLSWTSSRTRTWVAGENTLPKSDDEYEISGSSSVTRPNGNSFTMSVTSPLLVAVGCNWIKQGTMQITPSNTNMIRTLDYGTGGCDDQATLTMNGNTYSITLP